MKKILLTTAALGALATATQASVISTLDFESAGGYTTSITEFSDGSGDYFTRTDGSGIGSVGYTNTGFWFAGQDIDGEGATLPVSLSWTIDVTGYENLSFNFDAAEDDDGSNEDWDAPDYVHVFYSIDAGGEQNLIWFENDGSGTNSEPLLDTDFNGTGDGTELTETFQNFAQTIAGSGLSLTIRVEFSLDSGDEDFAMDNLQITGDAVPEPTTAALLGAGAIACLLRRRRVA